MGEACELPGCSGDPRKCKSLVTSAIMAALATPMPVALLYRWKGFERASAWAWRGRMVHDLLGRSFEACFPEKVIREAEQQLARAAAAAAATGNGGKDEVADVRAKQNSRAGSVIKSFKNDVGAARLHSACLLNRPVQHFLNEALAAEAAVTKCTNMLTLVPADASENPTELADQQSDAFRRNLKLISGRSGQQVVQEMFDLVKSFSGPVWCDLRASRKLQYDICRQLLVGMTDAWRRLCFYYQQPKFEIFQACAGLEFNHFLARKVGNSILLRSSECPKCIDPLFSLPFAKQLADTSQHVSARAHRCLFRLLSCTKLSSSSCERKHLLGQESRLGRKRGRGLQCESMSKLTYRKSVKQTGDKLREMLLRKHFGSDTEGLRRFSQSLAGLKVFRSRRGGKVDTQQFKIARERNPRRVRPYDVFMSEEKHHLPAQMPWLQKKRVLDERWRLVSDEDL